MSNCTVGKEKEEEEEKGERERDERKRPIYVLQEVG